MNPNARKEGGRRQDEARDKNAHLSLSLSIPGLDAGQAKVGPVGFDVQRRDHFVAVASFLTGVRSAAASAGVM